MNRTALILAPVMVVLGSTVIHVQNASDRPFWRTVVMGTKAMVAAEHPLEARAAQKVLEAGGNAIDAAVATFYMTTVVEHHQAGIGGDAFIVAYLADRKKVVFINGTGYAPALATREKYQSIGEIPDEGPFASSVPGAVAGFDLALRTYGTKKYPELLQPAIDAALNGHPVSVWGAGNHVNALEKISKYPSSARALLKQGKPFEPGDLFVQPDLGRTLQTMAKEGPESFYKGSIARSIAAFYEQHGGLIRYDDLSTLQAEEAAPIKTSYKGYEVYQSAPNSQGITMLIALNILESFDLAHMEFGSADYVHVVTEAMKLAFADRNQYIGDPRFIKDMPVEALLSQEYANTRRGLIRMSQAIQGVAPPGDPRRGEAILDGFQISYHTAPTAVSRERAGEQASKAAARSANAPYHFQGRDASPRRPRSVSDDGETSSFSIADAYGNLVSVTHSVNGTFGSGMVIDGLGFVLNNRMPYFSLEEGDVNVLAPKKRPRHTINPALALKDGKPFLAWNTPGGDNQPQAMLQAFLNVVEFGMNVQQAVEAPTVTTTSFRQSNYPQPAPNRLVVPKLLATSIGDALTSRGHALQVSELQPPYQQTPSGAGAVKMVLIDSTRSVMFGGVSPAKDNYVIGW